MMEELLKAMLDGATSPAASPSPRSAQADPLAEMLEGILGGGGMSPQAAPAAPSAGGIDITDIIGAVIGQNASRGQTHQNGISDMINAIMGGGTGRGGINPIAQMIADKTGIPPAIAQMAVAYFMSKMFQGQAQPRGTGGNFQPRQAEPDGLDLDDLLDSMDGGGSLGTHFANNGMADELAQKTGLSSDKANEALQEILSVIGSQRVKPNPVTARDADLKDLLDNW